MKYVYKKNDVPEQQCVRVAQAGPLPATGPVDELEAILEEYRGKADAARAEAQAAREKADALRAVQVEAEQERCLAAEEAASVSVQMAVANDEAEPNQPLEVPEGIGPQGAVLARLDNEDDMVDEPALPDRERGPEDVAFLEEPGAKKSEADVGVAETGGIASCRSGGVPGVLLDDGVNASEEVLTEALLEDLSALPENAGAVAEQEEAGVQAEPMAASMVVPAEPEPLPGARGKALVAEQEAGAQAEPKQPREKIGSPLWTEHAKRALRRNAPKAAVALSTAAVLLLCLFMGLFWQDSLVITDSDGMRKEFLMRSDSETDALDFAAPLAGPNDVLTYRRLAPRRAEVKIARAFPVALRADGKTHFIKTVGGSVSDLLADCGVTVSGEDFVVPAADTVLEHGTYAAVHRVTYEEEKKRTEIGDKEVADYKKEYEAKHKGEEFPESNAGLYDAQLRHRLVDGVVESTEVLSLTRVIVPRPADSYAFTPGIPQSRIVGYDDIEMDENGFPVNYTRVWQGAVCTAYSSSGGRGSSGLGLYCGTAAVNPNVIPYGTRMFITDASGYYVYGFCIATDTGTAMMEGYVDIDLYFEDNAECYAFGKRAMNVYFFD